MRRQRTKVAVNPQKHAFDTRLNIDKNTGKAALEKAMHGYILGEGELVGL
jgi:hypothetical protein